MNESPRSADDENSSSSAAALELLSIAQLNGVIDEDLAASLKKKYECLQRMVINTIENERSLLSKAQQLNESLLDTQKEVESKTNTVNTSQSELDELTQKMEENVIFIQEVETLIDMTKMETDSMNRSNKELHQEMIARRKKSELLLQPILERLNNEISTLNEEVADAQKLYETECQVRDEYTLRIEQIKEELVEFERTKLHKRQRLIRQKSEPERLEIQCQVLLRNVHILKASNDEKKTKLDDLNDAMDGIKNKRKEIDSERHIFAEKLMILRDGIDKKERSIDEITRKVEYSKHKIEDLEELRMQLTIECNSKKYELKRQNEEIKKLNRIYDENKRKYELLRRKQQSVKALILPLAEEWDRCVKKMSDLNKAIKERSKNLIFIKEDIDIFISQYLMEEDIENDKIAKLKRYKQAMCGKEMVINENKKRESLLKEKQRELTLDRERIEAECSTQSQIMHALKQKNKIKQIFVADLHKKQLTQTQNLSNYRKEYEIMKNSRNRYANLVQNTAQALSEMAEKIKIVSNELNILKNENVSKETALIEESRILTAAQYTRDQLRFELNKATNLYKEAKSKMSALEMQSNKLQLIKRQIEAEMIQIAQKYKVATKDRNKCGLQLIDRNDELSILYEKKNVLQFVLTNGERLITEKEQSCKQMELKQKDLRRTLEVKRKQLPSDEEQRICAQKYCKLENELKSTKKLSIALSKELQVPNPATNPNRYRKIASNDIRDPSQNELSSNICVLSSRLTNQKEQLLEKELILEEVGGLTEKLRLQAVEGHKITLLLAKKMNSLQYQLKKTTRCMMATVSELSMYQATSLKLENEKNNLSQSIMNGNMLLNEEKAPFESAKIEWLKIVRSRQTKLDSSSSRGINHRDWQPQSYDEESIDSQAQKTTAEPRPNAYIADDIGIPKPYGAHAPFKPSSLGANMRHIKKPKARQVIV